MRFKCTLVFLVLVLATTPTLAIETAGELFVDMDAATYTTGDATWANAGTYGAFTRIGEPMGLTIGESPAVFFNGTTDAFIGADEAPLGIVDFETRSIEAWVINPSIASEETIVSWGRRGGPEGSNMAFNYGNHGNFGAVGHWGGGTFDVGWVDNEFTPGAPEANVWHHLAYTYDDDGITRVFADGILANEEETFSLFGDLTTHGDTPIAIASQWEGDANLDNLNLTGGLKGSLGISRLRIHDGALTDVQILANYNEEKALFAVNPEPPKPPEPKPIPAAPVHRYSFSNPSTDEAIGMELTDSIGGAHGVVVGEGASFTGTELRLPGGVSNESPYGDLPNGLISSLTDTTIETWVTVEGSQSWARVFDFGSNSPGGDDGELLDLEDDNGGNTEGLDYLMLSASRGGNTNDHRLEIRDVDPGGGGIATGDFSIDKELPDTKHYAVVYDSDGTPVSGGPLISVYADGELMVETSTSIQLSDINDVNNWLGRSNWTNDANLEGSFDEFRIYDYALTNDEALGNFEAGPDTLNVILVVPGDCNGDGVVDAGDLACVSTIEDRDIVLAAIPTLAGDLDGNGDVAFPDFLVLSANFGQDLPSYTDGNIDLAGGVAFTDFLILSANFGQAPAAGAATASVPEPTSVVLLLIGSLWFVRCRRRTG